MRRFYQSAFISLSLLGIFSASALAQRSSSSVHLLSTQCVGSVPDIYPQDISVQRQVLRSSFPVGVTAGGQRLFTCKIRDYDDSGGVSAFQPGTLRLTYGLPDSAGGRRMIVDIYLDGNLEDSYDLIDAGDLRQVLVDVSDVDNVAIEVSAPGNSTPVYFFEAMLDPLPAGLTGESDNSSWQSSGSNPSSEPLIPPETPTPISEGRVQVVQEPTRAINTSGGNGSSILETIDEVIEDVEDIGDIFRSLF